MKNLIVIMSDQQRADSLGCYGNSLACTPHIDELAKSGAVFRQHMTPNQICSPSRSTLFSGLYPRHHGLTHNGISLPEDTALITHDFKRAGYRTHGVGKFHFQPILADPEYQMPDSNAFWEKPENQSWNGPFYGFDTVDMLIGESVAATQGGHYAQWLRSISSDAAKLYSPEFSPSAVPEDFDEVWTSAIPEELHYNSWIAESACRFLEDVSDDPFFLFVSFPDPHHPFSPPRPWSELHCPENMPLPEVKDGELCKMPAYISDGMDESSKSYVDFLVRPGAPKEQGFMQTTHHISNKSIRKAIAHTYGMVSMIDAKVGQIKEAVYRNGLQDNTVILFTSDHGELLGDHGLIRKGPAPYRQVLNIPLIFSGSGIAAGSRNQLTSHVDIRSTLQDYFGLEKSSGDGQSFSEMLALPDCNGQSHIFCEYHPRVDRGLYNQTVITKNWRLTIYPLNQEWGELFDRRNDPNEHENLFSDEKFAAVRDELILKIQRDWPARPDAGGEMIAVY
ncbi:sulfatase family protein [Kiloniella sp. b19]|uniref:sulfatase family protein n=1 Tax=Kiloniella sp. GXU_MW_B19 TaxID=3141326 RepID=UPI0031DC1CA0